MKSATNDSLAQAVLGGSGAGHVAELAARELEECREQLASMRSPDAEPSLDATLRPFNEVAIRLSNLFQLVGLLRCVDPREKVREACEEAEQAADKFRNELNLDPALYRLVEACDPESLDATARRFREHALRDFRRCGVDRAAATRARVHEIREELVALGQRFTRNIASDTRSIRVEAEELDGLPEDYVRNHRPDGDGRVTISTDYPHYNPFMAYAASAARRRELYTVFRLRAYPQNTEILAKLLERRFELARLLGYASWAEYATEDKMIRTPEAIAEFIERVSEAARPAADEELAILLEEKRRDEPDAGSVADWEKTYLEERVRARRFRVDSKQVRVYFEYERVKEGILGLTEDLFGVRFTPAPNAVRWHDDVEVLDVFEKDRRVARVYLDMHPRAGKFKHAAMFPIVAGVRGVQIPEAALVCNFPDPRAGAGSALLEHDDVVVFFHEFGHLLHHLFARDGDWVEFSGTGTEWDFVEVPSQIYEEWAWDAETLRRFAVHHETGEPIPDALVDNLRRARDFGRGLHTRHQMYYAAVSYHCYRGDPSGLDVAALLRELQTRYSPFPFVEGTHFEASFGHLDDYSALYYTYMWSLVIAKDIDGALRKNGSLDPDAARRYRECVLDPGGSRDARNLVRDFLGREYSYAEFERWLAGRENKSA